MTFSTQGHICKKLHLNPLGAKGTLCKSQSMCVQEHSSLRPLLFLPSGRFVKKQLSGAAKNFGTSAEEFAVRRCIHSTARHAAASGPGVPPPANPGCTIQFLQLGYHQKKKLLTAGPTLILHIREGNPETSLQGLDQFPCPEKAL